MFCIALIRAQMRPSAGILRTDWMIPPVTMSAVPMVSSTNPQKIPACMIAAPGSLNIFDWTKAYSTRPTHPRRHVGERAGRPGDREDAQVAGHDQEEERGRAPEDHEDDRVAGDFREGVEHRR